nr:MAG TPA: hypothetical protein [Caudoviricetes sp.]
MPSVGRRRYCLSKIEIFNCISIIPHYERGVYFG